MYTVQEELLELLIMANVDEGAEDPQMLMARNPKHVNVVDVNMAEQRSMRLHAATMRMDHVRNVQPA